MADCDVLSTLWKNRSEYNLINEELLIESAFIQQTSREENLWKSQLGMTENYIIFLRCDTDMILFRSNHSATPEQIDLLINMIPMSHLKIKKHSKRKLEVLFPSGSVCYFKLLMCSGCGKAWTRWRTLEQTCDTDVLPLAPKSTLISFLDLNEEMQKKIIDEKFAMSFTSFRRYWTQSTESVGGISRFQGRKPSPRTTDLEMKSDIHLQTIETVLETSEQTEKVAVIDKKEKYTKVIEKNPGTKETRSLEAVETVLEIVRQQEKVAMKMRKATDTNIIKRTSDSKEERSLKKAVETISDTNIIKRTSDSKEERSLKKAVETISDINIIKRTLDSKEERSFKNAVETIADTPKLKENVAIKDRKETDEKTGKRTPDSKARRKTRQIRRFGEGIPENCVFDLTLSYSDEIQVDRGRKIEEKEENGDVLMSLEERFLWMISRSTTTDSEENRSEKHISVRNENVKAVSVRNKSINKKVIPVRDNNNNVKINKKSKNKMKKVLNTAQYFTNVSLLIIPGGLRKSKSIDSVCEISITKNEKIYATRTLSFPNINDAIFYRRNNRLNYSMDPFDDASNTHLSENHSTHPVSFWLPDNQSGGKIYCTTPICRKASPQEDSFSTRNNHGPQTTPKTATKHARNDRGSLLTEEQRFDRTKSAARTPTGVRKPKEKRNTVSEAPSVPIGETESLRKSHKLNKKQNPWIERTFLEASMLEPYTVAYELQLIQQRMFCEIESSELARFILKPHTVTEINCPYLCGFLLFFERLKNLITAEVSAQKEIKDSARIYQLFVQVAVACFKRSDEQSAYAIIGGLCNPIILCYRKLWTYMLKQNEEMKYLLRLFKMCHKRKTLHTTLQNIPFFLNFVTFIIKNIIKEAQRFPFVAAERDSRWNALRIISNQERKNITRSRRVFSELRTLSYGNYESILIIIEECRKFFIMENLFTKDTATREYLLYKHFQTCKVK